MLSEAIHSVADSAQPGAAAGRRAPASGAADAEHQFGYGRDRYIYGFVVAIVLFLVGGLFSRVRGRPQDPAPRAADSPQWVAIVVLIVAIVLEGFSFRTAHHGRRTARAATARWVRFIRRCRSQPELPVVLLEDAGALVGLVFALLGVTLAEVTGDGGGTASGRSRSAPCSSSSRSCWPSRCLDARRARARLPGAGGGDPGGARGRPARSTGSSTCAPCTSVPTSCWSRPRSRCGGDRHRGRGGRGHRRRRGAGAGGRPHRPLRSILEPDIDTASARPPDHRQARWAWRPRALESRAVIGVTDGRP